MRKKNRFTILLYYKYVAISDVDSLFENQKRLCQELNLKGRIIVSQEGINGTVEGLTADTDKYVDFMHSLLEFADMDFKYSAGTGNAFPKLSIKVRSELVSAHLGENDVNPTQVTGKHLDPEELHRWFEEGKEFYIVDMRNDYEYKVGRFENSILPSLGNFRDLPKILPEIEHLKGKTVLTVCTGGVRCEKASGYLVNNGFNDVYQLNGGIVSYMEKYPNQNFLGKLYVFDGRITMGFNVDSPEHKVISECELCGAASDHYVDCNYVHCKNKRHFIACDDCHDENGNVFCSDECKQLAYVDAELLRR